MSTSSAMHGHENISFLLTSATVLLKKSLKVTFFVMFT